MKGTEREAAATIRAVPLAVRDPANLDVRLAVMQGRIAFAALAPGDDWPEMFASCDDMAAPNRDANARTQR